MDPKKLRYSRDRLLNELVTVFVFTCGSSLAIAAEEPGRPVDSIMDNSFLIEEAYNQEPGIVQHIFLGGYSLNRISHPGDRRLDLAFTQEWPAYGQAHQLSYTLPYAFAREEGRWTDGIGDVLLNYRYQAWFNEKTLRAFAPRFSLILPTGNEDRGLGIGTLGYQWNLPFSTAIGDRVFAHANAGLTFLPQVRDRPDFLNYNLGGSLIYCFSGSVNFMLEWIGTWNETGRAGEREFASVISPGIRYALNFKNGSQLVLGLGVPLGLTDATSEIGALFYLSFEHRLFGKEEASGPQVNLQR